MNLFLTLAFLFFIGSVLGWVLELFFRKFFSGSNPEHNLEDRELHPEYYKPPEGYYKQPHIPQPRALSEHDLLVMKQFYEKELVSWPDVMTIKQVSAFTGYGKASVERWCTKGHLQHFFIKQKHLVPKAYLLDFFVSWNYIGIAVKSELHIQRNKRIWAQAKT